MSEASIAVGIITGFYTGSIITHSLGSLYIFIVCCGLCLLAILYGAVRIKNIIPENNVENRKENSFKVTLPKI